MSKEPHGADSKYGPLKIGQRQEGLRADHPNTGPKGEPTGGDILKPDNKKSAKELKREQPDLQQHSQGHGAKQRDAG
jgi:hypothetical protein